MIEINYEIFAKAGITFLIMFIGLSATLLFVGGAVWCNKILKEQYNLDLEYLTYRIIVITAFVIIFSQIYMNL